MIQRLRPNAGCLWLPLRPTPVPALTVHACTDAGAVLAPLLSGRTSVYRWQIGSINEKTYYASNPRVPAKQPAGLLHADYRDAF